MTVVDTPQGQKRIKDLRVGDQVFAYDENLKTLAVRSISQLYKRIASDVIALEVKLGDHIIRIVTTESHRFYVKRSNKTGYDWEEAAKLTPGKQLLTQSGRLADVVKIEESLPDQQVLNIQVSDLHNYFIGESKLLVHNHRICGGNQYVLSDWERENLEVFHASYDLPILSSRFKGAAHTVSGLRHKRSHKLFWLNSYNGDRRSQLLMREHSLDNEMYYQRIQKNSISVDSNIMSVDEYVNRTNRVNIGLQQNVYMPHDRTARLIRYHYLEMNCSTMQCVIFAGTQTRVRPGKETIGYTDANHAKGHERLFREVFFPIAHRLRELQPRPRSILPQPRL